MSRQVRSIYQTPKYQESWEQTPLFKGWLARGPEVTINYRSSPTTKAYCKHCEEVLEPTYKSLSDHAETPKHQIVVKARRNYLLGQNQDLVDSLESNIEEYLKMKRDYSLISSLVIDSMTGHPAEGLDIRLYRHEENADDEWELVSRGDTDSDGYLDSLIFHTPSLPVGLFRIEYMLQDYYYEHRKIKTTYPMVQPTFQIKEGMVQYHFKVNIAPHFHQVYLDVEPVKAPEMTIADLQEVVIPN